MESGGAFIWCLNVVLRSGHCTPVTVAVVPRCPFPFVKQKQGDSGGKVGKESCHHTPPPTRVSADQGQEGRREVEI